MIYNQSECESPIEHPCGRCGEREAAGAAGLCQECGGIPTCANCGSALLDGERETCCSSRVVVETCAICGGNHDAQACPDAHVDPLHDEAEMIHERAHAGLSDPDACPRDETCPASDGGDNENACPTWARAE